MKSALYGRRRAWLDIGSNGAAWNAKQLKLFGSQKGEGGRDEHQIRRVDCGKAWKTIGQPAGVLKSFSRFTQAKCGSAGKL